MALQFWILSKNAYYLQQKSIYMQNIFFEMKPNMQVEAGTKI